MSVALPYETEDSLRLLVRVVEDAVVSESIAPAGSASDWRIAVILDEARKSIEKIVHGDGD